MQKKSFGEFPVTILERKTRRFFHIYINFTPVYENWGMQSAEKMIKVHEITAITIIYCRKTKQFDFYQE